MKVRGADSGSADVNAAKEFLETLDVLTVEGNYLPEQIVLVDETPLFWKRVPERTFIHRINAKSVPGLKTFKDRILALLGDNAASHKLKPFYMAFKHINKHTPPVCHRSNVNSWVMQLLSHDALLCTVPPWAFTLTPHSMTHQEQLPTLQAPLMVSAGTGVLFFVFYAIFCCTFSMVRYRHTNIIVL